jgi:hypothetical protein
MHHTRRTPTERSVQVSIVSETLMWAVSYPSTKQDTNHPTIAITSLNNRTSISVYIQIDTIVKCREDCRWLEPAASRGSDRKPDPVDSKQESSTVGAQPEHPSDGVLVDDIWYKADEYCECR